MSRFRKKFASAYHAYSRYARKKEQERVVTLEPEVAGERRGRVLVANVLAPFLCNSDVEIGTSHTCDWEGFQIGKTFLDLGYSVDVINFHNRTFIPEKDYQVFVGALEGFGRLAPLVNEDCIKILHAVYAHWLINNGAQYRRLEQLKNRKGVVLPPVKMVQPDNGIEYVDHVTTLGNRFTVDSYRFAGKPVHRVPISATHSFAFDSAKKFDHSRKNFLWFGNGGLLHKGLDLVLEASAEMPEYQLIVCGPVDAGKEFEKAFRRELYETRNIRVTGWVDVGSEQFTNLASQCAGLVYASCSEAGGGSVIQCMHAGLIPIVSYESSVDVSDDFGVILQQSSIEEIRLAVRDIAERPTGELALMSRRAWQYAQEHHTRERFAEVYREVIERILFS